MRITPKRIRLLLSYGCNAQCFYCHNEGQDTPTKRKVEADFTGKLLDLIETEEVIFSGGEPTLHPRIADIAREVKDRDVYLSMNTNGSLTHRLEQLYGLVDEIKFSVDSLDKEAYEDIKKLSFERVLGNVLEAKRQGVRVKINAPFSSLENTVGLLDFSEEHGIDIKFIEILESGFGSPHLPIEQAEKLLQERGYALQPEGIKTMATKDDHLVTLMRCYCRSAVATGDVDDATDLCRSNTDLYVLPSGEIKPCIYGSYTVSIYDAVMDGDAERLQQHLWAFDQHFGRGPCHDAIHNQEKRRLTVCTK